MTSTDFSQLLDEVAKRHDLIQDYLFDPSNQIQFSHPHLEDAVYSYIKAGGKSLRPAVLMFSAGAVGGDEMSAIPAAASVELYHTFTLVHDDIIDRDELRRGVSTVHTEFSERGISEMGYDRPTAQHYGLAIAILAGDMQQGWSASLMPDLHQRYGVPPEVALGLVRLLFRETQVTLINGETLDILQAETPVDQLTEDDILHMLWQKTGILYQFAGLAGASIGLHEPDLNHPTVQAVGQFTGKCGTAFQVQDDILGITGSERSLGKPVGSDIREGKRTVIVLSALPNMSAADRDFTLNILGNPEATDDDIHRVMNLLRDAGGIDHAQNLARQQVADALQHLENLPETHYKSLLNSWAEYITSRDF